MDFQNRLGVKTTGSGDQEPFSEANRDRREFKSEADQKAKFAPPGWRTVAMATKICRRRNPLILYIYD